MRLLYWLITAPLLIFAISFAVSNRDNVSLSLWPLPFEITVPVAVVGLVGMLVGAIIGMIIAWAGGGKSRSRARAAEHTANVKAREVANLNEELRRTKEDQTDAIDAPTTAPKALSEN